MMFLLKQHHPRQDIEQNIYHKQNTYDRLPE